MEDLKIQSNSKLEKPQPVYPGNDAKLRAEDSPKQMPTKQKDETPRESGAVDAEKLVEKLKQHLKSFSTKIGFSIDRQSHRTVIIVMDKETGEVIRKIPPQEVMERLDKQEELAGLLFQRRV